MIFALCPVCRRMKNTVNATMNRRRIRTHHHRLPDTPLIEVVKRPYCAGSLRLVELEDTKPL